MPAPWKYPQESRERAIRLHLLPEVVCEVGTDPEVYLDVDIMGRADIVAIVAPGARFTPIGRAYLHYPMAGGREGERTSIVPTAAPCPT